MATCSGATESKYMGYFYFIFAGIGATILSLFYAIYRIWSARLDTLLTEPYGIILILVFCSPAIFFGMVTALIFLWWSAHKVECIEVDEKNEFKEEISVFKSYYTWIAGLLAVAICGFFSPMIQAVYSPLRDRLGWVKMFTPDSIDINQFGRGKRK